MKSYKILANKIRAVDHPKRSKIIKLLKGDSLCVNDIYKTLRMPNSSQSDTSQHLAILLKAGFVEADRQGKHVYYTVSDHYYEFVETCDIMVTSFKNAIPYESYAYDRG